MKWKVDCFMKKTCVTLRWKASLHVLVKPKNSISLKPDNIVTEHNKKQETVELLRARGRGFTHVFFSSKTALTKTHKARDPVPEPAAKYLYSQPGSNIQMSCSRVDQSNVRTLELSDLQKITPKCYFYIYECENRFMFDIKTDLVWQNYKTASTFSYFRDLETSHRINWLVMHWGKIKYCCI